MSEDQRAQIGNVPEVPGAGPERTVRAISSSDEEERLAARLAEIAHALATELHPGMPGLGELGADASIERDFGLDSLSRVELALRAGRRLGTAIPEAALAESETVRDLARALLAARPEEPPLAASPEPIAERRDAPAAPRTLVDALEWHASEHPDRTYILLEEIGDGAGPLTFGALHEEAAAVAAGLVRWGIGPGETVALMLPTGREFFAAFFGALLARAIPVPLYPPARASQIEAHLQRTAAILDDCEARLLVTFERAIGVARLLRSLDAKLESSVTVAQIAVPRASLAAPRCRPGDTAFLQYTSGSTGRPKGVVLTHANLLANLQAMQRVTGVTAADRFVSWLPLYHDMGLIGACLGALVFGFPLVLMSPLAFLTSPVRWLRAIERHRATITAAPNFAYELCLEKIPDSELEGLDLGSLRLAFNGAEPVSAATLERFAARFASYGFEREALTPVYGLAECALGLTFPPPERGPRIDCVDRRRLLHDGVAVPASAADPDPVRIVSCGSALPGHAVRIVAEDGSVLPERGQGRIEFRGPSATSGYFRNPQANARLVHDGWLDTGDLGYLAEGELHVTGRAKDVIIRYGHNIHPQELEEAIARLSGVRKGGVAVFPASDRRMGTECVVVLAETRVRDAARRAELVARIRRLAVDLTGQPADDVVLAPPRTVLKTSSGKIRRAACREAYERGELIAPARPAWRQWIRLLRRATGARLRRGIRGLRATAWGSWTVLVAACLAPVVWLAVLFVPGTPRRRRAGRALLRTARWLAGLAVHVPVPPHVPRGPRVYVANHASYLDGPLLMATLPPDVAFVVKRELATSLVIGRLLVRLGCVFVERRGRTEAAAGARALEERLRAGESLVVFAEGTFRREPGLLPFRMGAFAAATAAGVEVVTVAISGTRDMLPAGTFLPRPARICVTFGEPLVPEDRTWRTAVALRQRAREQILEHVREPDLEHGLAGEPQPMQPAAATRDSGQ